MQVWCQFSNVFLQELENYKEEAPADISELENNKLVFESEESVTCLEHSA
jgi:hypothetical protein